MAVKSRAVLRAAIQKADPVDQARDLIDSVAVGTQAAAIADVAALTGGESPTEAEFNALAVKFNALLAAARAFGIIAT